MNCTYTLLRSNFANRTCFGIKVINNRHQTVTDIHDISENGARVTQLVQLCNSLKLSDIHIFDVIDDFIG